MFDSTFEVSTVRLSKHSPVRSFVATHHVCFIALFCCLCYSLLILYRDRLKGLHILLSNSQAGPGRKVKQEQEEISRNHVQDF